MERPVQKPIGSDLQSLDTPALFLDSNGVANNWTTLNAKVRATGKKLRSNASVYRTPALAHSVGIKSIYVDTVSEGLCFAEAGIEDILVGRIPQYAEFGLFKSLEAQCNLSVCISSFDELRIISESREESARDIPVLFKIALDELDLGLEPNDELMEILCEGPVGFDNIETGIYFRITSCIADTRCAELFLWLEKVEKRLQELHGSEMPVVVLHNDPSESLISSRFVTEIIEDGFLFVNNRISPCQSGTMGVIASVTSHPEPHLALLDCGQKSIAIDRGLPSVLGNKKRQIERMSAEHGFLAIDSMEDRINLGEKVVLSPANAGDTFNIYDYVNVMRDERLAAVWRIESRGKYN